MLYELATLTLRLWDVDHALDGLLDFTGAPDAQGTLLGSWAVEIGPMGQRLILRGFPDAAALDAERRRTLASARPFGIGDALRGLSLDRYAPFPFLPPVQPGRLGPVYEIRRYGLQPGSLAPTLAAWQAALPARLALSPLAAALHSLDGTLRTVQFWPYPSLESRAATRAAARVLWPPPGAAELVMTADTCIARPTPESPLR